MLTRDQIHIGVFPRVLRERYNVSDVVGSHPDNRQSVAQFLEQYYSPTDLKEFFLPVWWFFQASERDDKSDWPKQWTLRH